MAVRNNIGKVKTSLDKISRQAELFDGITQYGLGTVNGVISATADLIDGGEEPSTDFIFGVHRWGSDKYRVGK